MSFRTTAAALVIVATLGFLLGRMSAPRKAPPTQASPNALAPAGPAMQAPGPETPAPQPQITQPPAAAANLTPLQALAAALDQPVTTTRQRLFAAALANMRPEDGPAIHQLFLDGDAQGRHFFREWTDFWTRWGELDPDGAFAYINSGSLGTAQARTSTDFATRNIGYRGESAARDFLASLDLENSTHQTAAAAVIGGLAEIDLQAATGIALANASSPFFASAIEKITDAAVQSGGIDNLTTWFDNLPAGSEVRAAALVPTQRRVARAGIETERTWLTNLGPSADPTTRKIFVDHSLRAATDQPAETLDWLSSLPVPENGTKNPNITAITHTMGRWAKSDHAAAAAWLDTQDDHPNYDYLAASIATATAPHDLRAAVQRATSISDPAIQSNTLKALDRLAAKSDP